MSSATSADERTWAAERRWEPVLSGLRAEALDCLQTTMALTADEAYGTGAHLALGCRWRFPAGHPRGAVRVQRSLPERMAEATELLGLRVSQPEGPMGVPELRRRLVSAGPLYVVADAYDLRWLPYAARRHMPHSFLLEIGRNGYTVVDAYHNDTEWGPARPGVWTLPAAELDNVVRGGALAIKLTAAGTQPPQIDGAAVMAGNAAAARLAARDIDSYAASVRAGLDQPAGFERLVLDIWLLCRERLLHTCWLGAHPAATAAGAAAHEWQRLAAQSYLALRRAQRGAPCNDAIVDDMAQLLHSDAALVAGLTQAPPPAGNGVAVGEGVTSAVLTALRVTLQLGDQPIDHSCALRSLPRFDSFQLVDIIDRVEVSLGAQMPADAAADDLADVAGLCRLFARAVADEEGWSPRR